MNSPQTLYILRWLIRDTFSQALASRTFWIMLAVSGLCTLFCLGVSIEGGDRLRAPDDDFLGHPVTGQPLTGPSSDLGSMKLLFGMMRVNLPRDRASGVHFLQVILGSWVAGSAGVLLTLVWACGLVPDFLQPGSAAVMLTKPPPPWLLLTGKFLGVVLFVAVQSGIFFGATWFALGLSTGVWNEGYLAGAPLMVLHFAALYSFAVLLGVCTRNAVACVLGTLLFWVVCLCVNSGRHTALALPELSAETPRLSPLTLTAVELSYWVLPKPLDYLIALEQALGARSHMMTLSTMPEVAQVMAQQRFDVFAIVLTSLAGCAGLMVLSGVQLAQTEL